MAYLETIPNAAPEIDIFAILGEEYIDAIKTYSPDKTEWGEKILWIKERDKMAVHISGTYPMELISTRRPNEQLNIFNYRMSNYEPTTQPIIWQAIDSLDRIFNPQNYTLSLGEKLGDYLDDAEFNGYSFIDWFQNIYKTFMLEDPNGLIVCYPSGEGLKNASVPVEPRIAIINCDAIIGMGERAGEYKSVLYLKESESDEATRYFCFIDTDYFIELRYECKGQIITALSIYPHNLGYLPIRKTGGKWNTRNGIFESFLHAFVPEANQALREESDHIGSLVTCGHPYRIIEPTPCQL